MFGGARIIEKVGGIGDDSDLRVKLSRRRV
jgi:hypothetical protein